MGSPTNSVGIPGYETGRETYNNDTLDAGEINVSNLIVIYIFVLYEVKAKDVGIGKTCLTT